ncbi:Uncharacterized protein TCM_042574 [Theobroma cacao]|uniref:Uncharacterized protein n=1 Tax=Theobroma cacao TaxID=3641 RepID=A0A061FKL3_THECC|nr:Uncharacterized protein TCM_042574 [Theobroma cacao]
MYADMWLLSSRKNGHFFDWKKECHYGGLVSDFQNGWMVPVSMITMLVFKVLDECFMCSDSVFAADFVAIIAAGCSWSLIFMFGCVFQALSGLALSSCSVNVQV